MKENPFHEPEDWEAFQAELNAVLVNTVRYMAAGKQFEDSGDSAERPAGTSGLS